MRFSLAAAVSCLAASAMAVPSANVERNAKCLTDKAAHRVANNFKLSISAYTDALARKIFATNLNDYSDSVSELINAGCPNGPATLGQATFNSLDSFIAGQGSQPNITFNILQVWHNCETVTMRWEGPKPNPFSDAPQQAVRGIIVMETTPGGRKASEPYLIKNVYSEFNSGAWMADLGIFTPSNCSAAATKRDATENIFKRFATIA